jgi:hypothetical protein
MNGRFPAAIERLAAAAACGLAVAVAAFGLVKGTRAVGGSDSSCYALMAEAFARGEAQPTSVLAEVVPWAEASRSLAPAGFLPSPVRADAASPVCAPGFALLLAPFRWVFGVDGIFLVTPLAGALLVWLAFVLGRHLAGAPTGAGAAIVTASLPVMLFQVVQPMNDVAVAALWLLVIAAAILPEPSRPWALGAVTGLAVLVRPNLAPAAVVVVVWLLVTVWKRDGWSRALVRAALGIGLGATPFAVTLVMLNRTLYGHPLNSGYGALSDLFSTAHLGRNVGNYGAALWATQRAFPLLGLVALFVVPKVHRALVLLLLTIAAATAAVYLLYRPFPEWWYLRFLLPALVPMGVLACAVVTWTTSRGAAASRAAVATSLTLLVALGVGWFQMATAAERQVLDLQRLERRFRTTGELVRDRFSRRAVFIAVWQSGTLRYHAGREAVLWDAIAPDALDGVVQWLSSQGFEPYVLTEEWEEPLFRERFSGVSALGALDWPPRFDIERQVRIYSPADRERYRTGENVPTEFVMPR